MLSSGSQNGASQQAVGGLASALLAQAAVGAAAALLLLLLVCRLSRRPRSCVVVVLGDFGRSPRMQFHALSLARQAELSVTVVAYGARLCLTPLGRPAPTNLEERASAPEAPAPAREAAPPERRRSRVCTNVCAHTCGTEPRRSTLEPAERGSDAVITARRNATAPRRLHAVRGAALAPAHPAVPAPACARRPVAPAAAAGPAPEGGVAAGDAARGATAIARARLSTRRRPSPAMWRRAGAAAAQPAG